MKRETAKQLLADLGGTVCLNGFVLAGDDAINFLERMPDQDSKSLTEDMKFLETQQEENP